jgi:heat shock protein HslJ
MKRTVIIIWVVIAALVVLFALLGLKLFRGNQASVPPTALPTVTSVPPTALPTATSVPPTVKPTATSVPPTAKPTATSVPPTATGGPTAKPSATSLPPTAKPTATHVPPTATLNPVQNIIWKWESVTEQSTGAITTVPTPASYTISFYADGTLSGLADCNTFMGTYSQKSGFTIKIGATTSSYCGETSMDTQYLQLLSHVAAGGPDGAGGLALETAGGAERMFFKSGGTAVKP